MKYRKYKRIFKRKSYKKNAYKKKYKKKYGRSFFKRTRGVINKLAEKKVKVLTYGRLLVPLKNATGQPVYDCYYHFVLRDPDNMAPPSQGVGSD